MKRVFKVSAMLAVAVFTLTSCNCYKKMAKNQNDVQLVCTPEVLELNNGVVEADITVKFPVKYFNAKAVVKVTPVMVFEGGEVAGAAQYFQGTKIQDNYTVIDANQGGEYTMHVSFPYDARMECSQLQLRAEVKCKSGKCKEFTLVNLNTGLVPSKAEAAVLAAGGAEAEALARTFGLVIAEGVNVLQSDLNYAEAMQVMESGYKNVTTEVTRANYMYAINSSNLSSKAKKSEELTAFQQKAAEQKDNDRIKQNLYVNGYASPDGPEKFNDKLAGKRSQSGLKAVQKLLAETGLNIDAAAYGEDWDGFKAAVAASNIQDKDLILQVLSMYSSAAEREKEIKNLASVFGALKTEVLPQLRRAQIVNTIDVTGKTDAEMVALVNAGNAAELSLEELLHIAEAQPAVAEAALKAASSKYGDARAYNNLAIVLAKQGDYAGALKALDSAAKAGSKSEELNNNYALVYLAMGETDKAAEYAKGANAEVKALAAAAKGEYSAAVNNLEGYNAAIAQVQEGKLAAAKSSLNGDQSAKADYLRAVIAAKEGNISAAKAALQSAIAKDASLAKKAAKDVNLAALR